MDTFELDLAKTKRQNNVAKTFISLPIYGHLWGSFY